VKLRPEVAWPTGVALLALVMGHIYFSLVYPDEAKLLHRRIWDGLMVVVLLVYLIRFVRDIYLFHAKETPPSRGEILRLVADVAVFTLSLSGLVTAWFIYQLGSVLEKAFK
jgi:hypothetical protein